MWSTPARNCHRTSDGTRLLHLLTEGQLAGQEEGLNCFALASHDHAWEAFEPPFLWDDYSLVQPIGEEANLFRGNLTFSDAVQKVLEEWRGGDYDDGFQARTFSP